MMRSRRLLCVAVALLVVVGPAWACGIGGMLLYRAERGKEEIEFARQLIARLLVENTPRGTDATGIALFTAAPEAKEKKERRKFGSSRSKGRAPVCLKAPIPAAKFVETSAFKSAVSKVSAETTIILGHDRRASPGFPPANNGNNHPIVARPIIGTHNGDISNHDEVFRRHRLQRSAQVDTEAIFRLIAKYAEEELTIEAVQKAMAELKGSLAIAFADERAPEKLFLVRRDLPLSVVEIPELNMVVYASKREYIVRAVDKAKEIVNARFRKGGIGELTLKDIGIAEGEGLVIDAKRRTVERFKEKGGQ